MRLFRFGKKEIREEKETSFEDFLLQAGLKDDEINRADALNIPAVASSVEIIGNIFAMLPIKLFEEKEGTVREIIDDERVKILNSETGDTLDAFQFKKAMITDYLLNGNCYAYINRDRNKIKSLHYVEESRVVANKNLDPIFKNYLLVVNGQSYKDYEFLKITRKTVDGVTGKGIIQENKLPLITAYNTFKYENILIKTGGNKKGFIKAQSKLTKEAIRELKDQWNKMYKNNTENCVVLNNGLEFKESSSTSVELQLNQNKESNSNSIASIFGVAPSILNGTANDDTWNNFIKIAILPILKAFTTACDKDLLLASEKSTKYFTVDIKEILRGDMEKRFKAYNEAIKAGWISKNEIRYLEDYEKIDGLDVITMSLGDVIFDINSKKYFTPNTDSIVNVKGGENNEDRD